MSLKDFLKETLELGKDDVFKVDVKESFSFFNPEKALQEKVLAFFTDFKHNGRFVNVEVSEDKGRGGRGGGRRNDRRSGGRRSKPRNESGSRSDRRSGERRSGSRSGSGNRSERRSSEFKSSSRRSDSGNKSGDFAASRPRRSRRK